MKKNVEADMVGGQTDENEKIMIVRRGERMTYFTRNGDV